MTFKVIKFNITRHRLEKPLKPKKASIHDTLMQLALRPTMQPNGMNISSSGPYSSSSFWSFSSSCSCCSSVFHVDFIERTRKRIISSVTTTARTDSSSTITGKKNQSPSLSTCASEIQICSTSKSKFQHTEKVTNTHKT